MNKTDVQILIAGYVAVHYEDIVARKEGAAQAALDYTSKVFNNHLTEEERIDCSPESVLYYELFNYMIREV